MVINKAIRSTAEITALIKIVSELRSPKSGCPWDLEQTHTSLIPYLLEEAHEVVDAIRNQDDENLKEELGDLLLQIVLHAQIAQEDNRFCFEDIAKEINNKLIRRHPHVFGGKRLKNSDEVKKSWKSIKMQEKSMNPSKSPLSDNLRRKVRSQTAIAGAMEISKETASAGFEWKTIEDVWRKVDEELKELKQALDKKNMSNAEEELGDLIFTLINIGRWCEISPEEGLAGCNQRFLDRFSYVESTLEADISKYSLNELSAAWKIAKRTVDQQEKKKNIRN